MNDTGATRSTVAKRSITDAWSGDVRMEIPETHVSLGEIQRYLRQWLGHDVSVGGSVVRDAQGISLTVRGSEFAGKTFAGEPNALPALLKRAAEYSYGQSEPVLFGYYLLSHHRSEDAIAVARNAYSSALEADKPLLLNIWGNALSFEGRFQEGLEKFRLAVELNPDFWIGYNNVINSLVVSGQEEAAADAGRQMERRAGRGKWFASKVPTSLWTTLDQLRWDLTSTHLENQRDIATSAGHGGSPDEEVVALDAFVLAEMHDPRGATLDLQTAPGAESDPHLSTLMTFMRGVIELDRGAYSNARAEFRHLDDGDLLTDVVIRDTTPAPACYAAVAEEMMGDSAKADEHIARGGRFVDCYRFKGDISDHRGNWEQAQKDYAMAVSLAPSIPSSYESWGEALARHANYAAALEKFRQANAHSPHWADPLEHWGEALGAQGKYREAIEKYNAAQRYAPNWAQLYLHWGRALDAVGKHREAVERYRRALELDLKEEERKSLAACCS
ncbi:MAG: hypothetical protein JWL65_4488 [Gammaproteobacteria bacterium]|nr:hypothetical protein [Gammaproteobacteria bacterium]